MGNFLAPTSLLLTIPLSIFLFAKFPTRQAALLLLFGSMLFLPVGVNFDPPLVPPLDKDSIPALCALVGVFVTAPERVRAARLGRGIDVLGIISILGVFGTFWTNRDPLQYGPLSLPGLAFGDWISDSAGLFFVRLAPFLLGRLLMRSAEDARALMRALTIGGVIYIPFILIELRMSPQFQNWVYGFLASQFLQSIREGGGYRPIVFMGHGLALALFMWASVFGAWTLVRTKETVLGRPAKSFALAVTVTITLLKSLGALIYAIVTVPLSWWSSPKAQMRIARVLALIVVLYPLLRATGVFPVQQISDYAARYSQDRAGSLQFRFDNEDKLLAKALERPVFGWGGWGRGRVFNEEGRDTSVTDGLWVIFMGAGGAVLFVCQFGLMLVPIFMASKRLGQLSPSDQSMLAGASILSIIHSVDLLPNSGYANMPMFLAGTVAGLAQGMKPAGARAAIPASPRAIGYSGAPPMAARVR